MHQTTHVRGVDPGLVHTGCVGLDISPLQHEIVVTHKAIDGLDAQATRMWCVQPGEPYPATFIEGYRSRSNLGTDAEMLAGVRQFKQKMPWAEVLMNTGVKKVVKRQLLEVFGIWTFPTVTHHQDLRSAARIALLGMLKDEGMNQLVADIVKAYLDGRPWNVLHA